MKKCVSTINIAILKMNVTNAGKQRNETYITHIHTHTQLYTLLRSIYMIIYIRKQHQASIGFIFKIKFKKKKKT